MRLFKHRDEEHYTEAQIELTLHKLKHKGDKLSWASCGELARISTWLQGNVTNLTKGVCHGCRAGYEVREFRRLLDIDVFGTEIAPVDVEHVIQWDFHYVKPEWLGTFDFIYSNSLDHSRDPEACVSAWMRCLSPSGVCIIHWTRSHNKGLNSADCFRAADGEYVELFTTCNALVEEIGWEGLHRSKPKLFVLRNAI